MKVWTWLEEILLPLTVGVMLATWVYSGLSLLGQLNYDGQTLLGLPAILLVWLSALFLTRWALARPWSQRAGQLFIVVAGLLIIGAVVGWHLPLYQSYQESGIPPVGVATVICVWLWWRGIAGGREEFYYQRVYDAFVLGIGWWLVILGVAYVTQGARAVAFVSLVLLYFMAGLIALAIASLAAARREEHEKSGLSLGVNRYWLTLTGGVIASIVLLGLLVGALVTPELIASLLRVIQPVLDLFARVLYLVFVAIVYILFLVLEPLINFIRNLPRDTNQPPQPIEMPDLQRQLEEASRGQAAIPAWVSSLSHVLLILGALMIVILLFALAFRQFYGYKEDGIEEDREFIGSWDLLRAQLADLLARLQPKPGRAAGQPFLPLEGEDGRRIIRQMYQTLLAAASRAGYKRAPEQTPIEYLDTLAQWKPDFSLPLHILTDAYDEARYSQAPISDVQLNVAQQAWRTLQRLLTGARLYDETTNGHAPQEMGTAERNEHD